MQLVDKNNGNPLFEPWLPPHPECQTKEILEKYDEAKEYIFRNGVPLKKYEEFLKWKEKAASKGVPENMLTYEEYDATCFYNENPIDFRYIPW